VKELARELDVSVRSLSRDIELLRSSGVPIDADRGRGGGVRLQRQWSFGRLHLDLEEGIDLLLSIAVAEKLNSPLLLRRLRSIRQKVATSFPEAQQNRIKMLRNRILIGPPASEQVMKTYRMNAPEQLTTVAACVLRDADAGDPLFGRGDAHDDATDRAAIPLFLRSRMVPAVVGPSARRHPDVPHRSYPARRDDGHRVPLAQPAQIHRLGRRDGTDIVGQPGLRKT
jgi:hypothetical protein